MRQGGWEEKRVRGREEGREGSHPTLFQDIPMHMLDFAGPRHPFLVTPEPFPEPLDLSQTNTTAFFPPSEKQLPPLCSSQ